MATTRKPFQGVGNIIRFNWHFYVLSVMVVVALLVAKKYLSHPFDISATVVCILIIVPTVISLAVSFYVYDLSGLYRLNWLNDFNIKPAGLALNINAGFDEISGLLAVKYPAHQLIVFDFYDATKHTEISIERARKAYPPYAGTRLISTASLPLEDQSVDVIFLIFAAHEIRNDAERVTFFKELYRIIKPDGQIIVTEHLRNWSNFLAYNIGFLHFLSKANWHSTFANANLSIATEISITPFTKTFLLSKNASTS